MPTTVYEEFTDYRRQLEELYHAVINRPDSTHQPVVSMAQDLYTLCAVLGDCQEIARASGLEISDMGERCYTTIARANTLLRQAPFQALD